MTTTTVDDPAAEYAAEEQTLFPNPDPDPDTPAQEDNKARRRPGPPANPASGRQRKLAGAALRSAAKKAASPRKRAKPNAPVKPATPEEVYQRGAYVLIGWVAKPLAGGALAVQAAAAMPRVRPEKRAALQRQATALTLDSLTVGKHADALAAGVAQAADALPWMARALEQAAKIGPYEALGEAALAILFQVMVNHGMMPARPELGTVSPEQLAAEMMPAEEDALVG